MESTLVGRRSVVTIAVRFHAPMDRFVFGMTSFVLVVMGGLFYGLLRAGFAAGAVFVVAIVVFAYVYTPKSFHLDADALRIARPAGAVVVPFASVSEVEPLDRFLGLSLKVPPGGNSGLFGLYGTFWKRDLGKFRMYGRSATGAVLLRTSEGRIVVTPDRRAAFIAAIRERIQEHSQ